jgi:hypothetical protein
LLFPSARVRAEAVTAPLDHPPPRVPTAADRTNAFVAVRRRWNPLSHRGWGRVVKGGKNCLRPDPGGRDEQTPEARGTVGSVLT